MKALLPLAGYSTCCGCTHRRDRYDDLSICGTAELKGQIAARGQLIFHYLVGSFAPALPLKISGTHELRTVDDVDPVAAGDRDAVSPCFLNPESHQPGVCAVRESRLARLRHEGHRALIRKFHLIKLPRLDLRDI